MFTLQNQLLDQLLRDTSPERAVDVMRQMLTNCQQPLEHRAPVSVLIDPDTSRPAPFNLVAAEFTPFFAGLDIANFTGYIDAADLPDILVRRGWAAVFRGPVNIRANLFDNRRIALVVHDNIWADGIFVEAIKHWDGTDWVFDSTYRLEDSDVGTRPALNFHAGNGIDIQMADDSGSDEVDVTISATPFPVPITFSHNASNVADEAEADFTDTDSVTWTITDAGSKVTIEANTGVKYCRAQHQWEKNSGNPRVSVRLLDAWGGTETGAAFYVYIRQKYPTGTGGRDPNVIIGQDITFEYDVDGTPVTTDPSAWDDKIGMVKEFIGEYSGTSLGVTNTSKYISGWLLMDGSINASGNGGSGQNRQNYFVRGVVGTSAPDNTVRGANSHLHNIGLFGAFTGTKTYDPDNSGDLTSDYPAHRDHRHYVGAHCGSCDLEQVTTPDKSTYIITGLADDHTADQKWYTGGAVEMGSAHTSDHASITLRHDVYDPGHSHAGLAGENYNIPEYKQTHWIERGDNSYESIGI